MLIVLRKYYFNYDNVGWNTKKADEITGMLRWIRKPLKQRFNVNEINGRFLVILYHKKCSVLYKCENWLQKATVEFRWKIQRFSTVIKIRFFNFKTLNNTKEDYPRKKNEDWGPLKTVEFFNGFQRSSIFIFFFS